MSLYPQGKGMYIWRLAGVFSGDLNRMVANAKTLELQWVSIKMSQSGFPYQSAGIQAAVDAFKQAGIEVWGWGYVLGSDGSRDISAAEAIQAAAQINGRGLAGWMIDGEVEYQSLPNARSLATSYINALTSRVDTSKIGIGLNSFRYASVHGPFPFKEFLDGCTFHIPQVYWEKDDAAGGELRELDRSLSELQAIRNLPYVPLGIACLDNDWKPTPDQLLTFNQGCLDRKLPGVGWYEWGAMNLQPELEDAIMRANGWNGTPPPPLPPPPPAPAIDPALVQRYLDTQRALLNDFGQGRMGTYTPA